jgi:hypothetical protein
MLLEFEHQLNSPKLVRNAKINCGGGTEEVHCSRTVPNPGINIFEVKSGFFLLKKYSHTLRHTLRSLRFAPANYRRINYTCAKSGTGRLTGMRFTQTRELRNPKCEYFSGSFLVERLAFLR